MRTSTLSLLLGFALPLVSVAGDPSAASSNVFRSSERSPVAIRVKADYAEFPLMIITEQKELDYQLYELGEARKHLVDVLKDNPNLKVVPSLIQLDAREGAGSSFSSSSAASGKANVALRYHLAGDSDLLSCTREVNRIVRAIAIPKNALYHYSVGLPFLGVDSTDAYRAQLLKSISEDAAEIKSIFGGTTVSVAGLSDAIKQHPVDDSHVELYLDYKVTVLQGVAP